MWKSIAGGAVAGARGRAPAAGCGAALDEPERDPAAGQRHDHPEGHPRVGQPQPALAHPRLPGRKPKQRVRNKHRKGL